MQLQALVAVLCSVVPSCKGLAAVFIIACHHSLQQLQNHGVVSGKSGSGRLQSIMVLNELFHSKPETIL